MFYGKGGAGMGQLIKLQDYVSRYDQDIFHYSSQFVRLKKQQWSYLADAYETGEIHMWTVGGENKEKDDIPDLQESKETWRDRIKQVFKRNKDHSEDTFQELEKNMISPEQDTMTIERFLKFPPKSLEDLKKQFLNQIFRFQLKWASSTIQEKSMMSAHYFLDEKLRFFLQRFPDNHFVFYRPILQLKNAPVELEIIFLTPTELWCLTFLEAEEDAVFIGGKERFWTKKHHKKADKKVLNPFIALNRMEKITEQILKSQNIDFPIQTGVICRNGYIDEPSALNPEVILDKRSYPVWFEKMRNHRSPIKNQQLKVAQALLIYCSTAYTQRLGSGEGKEEGHGESGI